LALDLGEIERQGHFEICNALKHCGVRSFRRRRIRRVIVSGHETILLALPQASNEGGERLQAQKQAEDEAVH